VARITELAVSPLDEYSVQERSRGCAKVARAHPLEKKMGGGEYRADNFSRWRVPPLENAWLRSGFSFIIKYVQVPSI